MKRKKVPGKYLPATPQRDLGIGKLIDKPLSSILKARHFFLFTSIFKKILFNKIISTKLRGNIQLT